VDGPRGAGIATEFDRHGETFLRYGSRLGEFPEFQFETEDGVRGHALPVRWDGTVEDLPRGIDGSFERAFEEGGGNVLCAVNVTVPPGLRGRGLSRKALQRMIELARGHDLGSLIAPVKPTMKYRYPITPIERYAEWLRDDGLLFDPWMRTHERLGARILKPERESVRVSGSVSEWEKWTEMDFPESGEYVIPGGLQLLAVDREADSGLYYEPNVWMIHEA
jgi:GNAT superfamily N-acetyltransferase